jgi:LPPG:FO 2-phospho-L-lactate transferase
VIGVLSGGVGAARMLSALALVVPKSELVAIVNTGDDLEMHGLSISPDLDTITYTLAGAVNEETGWGLTGETYSALSALRRYGLATWFTLGDTDLGTHIFRTMRLRGGASLSEVTAEISAAWDIGVTLLPMSDDPVRTRLRLVGGDEIDFQEYFVKLAHEVAVEGVRFDGIEAARPAPGVLDALANADVIVIAPSNPIVSIGPILGVRGIAEALRERRSQVVAVSPIIAGRALKGPADRLLVELGEEPTALGVARRLAPFAGSFVIDSVDAVLAADIEALGLRCSVTDTIMRDPVVGAKLARVVLATGAGAISE